MSTGRLIIEYRHAGRVTTIDRPIPEAGGSWRDPSPETLAEAGRAALRDLLLAEGYREADDAPDGQEKKA